MREFMRFVTERYFPCFFIADLLIWGLILGAFFYWATR